MRVHQVADFLRGQPGDGLQPSPAALGDILQAKEDRQRPEPAGKDGLTPNLFHP